MIKTDMVGNTLPENTTTNEPRYFTITYNYNDKNRQQRRATAYLVALSFNNAVSRIEHIIKARGGGNVNIETTDSGGRIDNITPEVMSLLYKRNKSWLVADEKQAAKIHRKDIAAAKRSAQLTIGADEAKLLRHII